MIFARYYNNVLTGNLVNEAMFFGNSSAPASFQVVLERFGLADTFKRLGLNILNKLLDMPANFLVRLFPVIVFFQSIFLKNNFPHITYRSLRLTVTMFLPFSTSFMRLSNILRLASLARRYSVSSISASTVIKRSLSLNKVFNALIKSTESSFALIWYAVVIMNIFFTNIQIINHYIKFI